MRVVLAPVGSRGDVQPLLALGVRLKARGHDIAVACSPDFTDWVESLGFEARPYGPSIVALSKEVGSALRNPVTFLRLLRHHFETEFDGARDAVGDAEVLVGGGAQGVMTTFAEWKRIPSFYAVYCPTLLPSREHAPMPVRSQTLPAPLRALSWRAIEGAWELLFRGPMNRRRAALGLPPARGMYRMIYRGTRLLLACDPVLAPPPRDFSEVPLHEVGPFFLEESGARLPDEVERFLGRPGPPVIYVGFGSMVSDDARALTATIVEAAERAGVRALLSSGWTGLGDGELPRHCLAVGALPHGLLFPRVAAAIHHGGAGTTHAVARAGIPQVVVPHLLDQFFWGHRVWRCGLGARPIPARRLEPRRLARAIRDALAPATIAQARAQGVRMRAHDGVGRAVEALEGALSPAGAAFAPRAVAR